MDNETMTREEALAILRAPVTESFVPWDDVEYRHVTVEAVDEWMDRTEGHAQWLVTVSFEDGGRMRRGRLTIDAERRGRTPGRDDRMRAMGQLVPVVVIPQKIGSGRYGGRKEFVLVEDRAGTGQNAGLNTGQSSGQNTGRTATATATETVTETETATDTEPQDLSFQSDEETGKPSGVPTLGRVYSPEVLGSPNGNAP